MLDKKRTLIIASTPFQLIVATHLRFKIYDDNVELIYTNHSQNSENVVENIRNTGVFKKVHFIKNKNSKIFSSSRLNKAIDSFKNLFLVIGFLCSNRNYKTLAVTNISMFTILLYNLLRCRFIGNKQIELCIYEEGISTYSKSFLNGDRASLVHRLINPKGMIGSANKVLLFNKDLLEWDLPNGEVIYLPKMSKEDKKFVAVLNKFLGVDEIKDTYDKKVLFFEESHFADGFTVADVEIVDQIAEIVGKDNVFVKIHPRNPVNRFSKLGYTTNKDISIPWELIILNQEIENKVLVTISSGAVLYPYLSFGMDVHSYSLLNAIENKPGHMGGELGSTMQRVYKAFPNNFIAPVSINEFLEFLKRELLK